MQLGLVRALVHNDGVKETLKITNEMQADGVIGKYAIGGAVGATMYLEPAATLDVDIFALIPASSESPLLSLTPIYDYLKARGGVIEYEHIKIWRLAGAISPSQQRIGAGGIFRGRK
jgi:hypothetical protein